MIQFISHVLNPLALYLCIFTFQKKWQLYSYFAPRECKRVCAHAHTLPLTQFYIMLVLFWLVPPVNIFLLQLTWSRESMATFTFHSTSHEHMTNKRFLKTVAQTWLLRSTPVSQNLGDPDVRIRRQQNIRRCLLLFVTAWRL